MNKKIIYLSLAVAATLGNTAVQAQTKNDLNKEITLEREFDPVKKEVVKKTVLPKEIKKSSKQAVAPQFSDWTVPTLVPVEIPTMQPYGYRTRHNFSNQRGYLNLGAGAYLNIVASAGYRLIDKEDEQLGMWLQHNSTWVGKNSSKLIEQPSQRSKQRFNDNLLEASWNKKLNAGVLGLDGRLHFDSFNYYGGFGDFLKNHKTAFFDARVDGKWNSEYDVKGEGIEYEATATVDYAGYDKSHLEGIDGAKEFWINAGLGAEYTFDRIGDVGFNFSGDIVNLRSHDIGNNAASDHTYGMITLSPYYLYENDIFKAKAGFNVNFSFNDGTAVRFSPDVDLNFKIVKGVSLFAQATGGKEINHLGEIHDAYRYNDPLGNYGNVYVPFDGRVGVNVGPFVGLTAKAFAGYGFVTGQLDPVVPGANTGIYKDVLDIDDPTPDGPGSPYVNTNQYAAVIFMQTKCKGAFIGFDVNYKYRSLAEAQAQFIHTFTSDEDFKEDMRYRGYPLGDDGATTIFNLDVKAWPIKPLMVNVGLNTRINRSTFTRRWVYPELGEDGVIHAGYFNYGSLEMKNVIDLYVGARYSFSHIFSVWAQVRNLLNRQWEVMPGQGAQRLSLMGGISLNF